MVYAVALTAALGASPVAAISPSLSLTQLGHTAWRVQDDALPGRPTAIAQTNDGYIWIGTPVGLVRFDGAAFVLVAPPPDQAPRYPSIAALDATKDGSLWIGTNTRMLRWKNGKFQLYETPIGLYNAVREAPDGKIWASRSHTDDSLGPLCEVGEDRLNCYGPTQGVPFKNAVSLAVEKSGAIWIATSDKLARWQEGHSQVFAPLGLSRSAGLQGFTSVVVAPDGSIWSGVISGGPGLGLQHFTNDAWSPVISGDVDTSTWQVTALLFDRDDVLWVGTANRGIYRICASSIDHFGVGDGLSADSINAFREDREGNVWVVTANGVDKFRATRVVTFSSRQGLSSDGVDAVLASKSGAIWVSNTTALDRIDNGTVKTYALNSGFPGHAPTALFEDSLGRLWVGADDGAAVFERERFRLVGGSLRRPMGPILEFAEGPESTVWGVTARLPSRLVRMNSAEVLESIPAPTGSRFGPFASASDGALWMTLNKDLNCDLTRYANGRWDLFPLHNPPNSGVCGPVLVLDAHTVLVSEPGGIGTWHDGVVRRLTVEDGLPCANTYAMVFDRHGNLWLYQQCGIAEIESKQLLDWVNDPAKKLHIRLLDVSDGALPARTNFHPRGSLGADGKVWFANAVDLQFVDPEHGLSNTVVPPVQIQALRGDGRPYALGSLITLPALTRNVQIDFTALSFVVPRRVQFQYRLEGWDIEWQRPAGRRQAFYTNLRPGTYRFSVLASNDDGLWNARGDTLEFKIEPAYFQTWWFRLLCVAGVLMLMQRAYALRLRRAETNIQQRLAARLGERERIARELHDTFLQSVQGLVFKFDALANTIPPDSAARNKFEGVLTQMDDVISEGRARVLGLRGADQPSTELADQLNSYGNSFREMSSAAFKASVVGQPVILNPVAADELLNIGREAIANCFAHSQARNIEVELIYNEKTLALRVRDDGKGMEPKTARSGRAGHWGIVGMRERARSLGATLKIWSRPGSGTEIELIVRAASAYAMSGASRKRVWVDRLIDVLRMRNRIDARQPKDGHPE
jgi:signal transduction histidine kinase/ligand-binding sensor domain-containing protein